MKKIINRTIAIIALVTIAGTAHAKNDTFQATLSYNENAPVEVAYKELKESATDACVQEALRAGFRYAEPKSWQVRKCTRELVEQATQASGNKQLIAFHEFTVNPRRKTIEMAASK